MSVIKIKSRPMPEAIIVGITSIVTLLIKKAYDYIKFKIKRQDQFEDGLARISAVYGILNELSIDTGAGRAMLLKCTNGGGIPRVGSELFSTVLYEAFEKLPPMQSTWQDQRIDKQCTEMLFNVYKTGMTTVITDEMEPGDLKDLYKSDGVEMSKLYTISTANDQFVYLSLDFEQRRDLTARERNIIRRTVNELRNHFH